MKPLDHHNILFYKAKSLNAELEAITNICDSFKHDFMKEVHTHRGERKPPLCVNPNVIKESLDEVFESKVDQSLFKPLYRKIMLIAHPDKLITLDDERAVEFYSRVCSKARIAMDEASWYGLYDAALDLGVNNIDIKNEHINLIKEECKKIQEKIKGIKNSVAWIWFHADNEEKDKYIKYYVKKMSDS